MYKRTHLILVSRFGRPVVFDQANSFLRCLLVSEFRRIHKTKRIPPLSSLTNFGRTKIRPSMDYRISNVAI